MIRLVLPLKGHPVDARIDHTTSTSKFLIQVHFCVPITPTRMRLVYFFFRNFALFGQYIPYSDHIFQRMSDTVINQDVEVRALLMVVFRSHHL